MGEVCSHVAGLLFKIEAANRLGHTRPSVTSLPCQWNKNFKTGVSLSNINVQNTSNCALQVTPKEIADVAFIKPTHKRGEQFLSCAQAEEEAETPSVKRILESGPQDAPRLPVQKLFSALFELVPQACLFTVVEPPSPLETLPTIERVQDQLEVPMLTSCISNQTKYGMFG